MAKKRQYANSNPVRLNPVSFEMIEEKLKKIQPGRKITIFVPRKLTQDNKDRYRVVKAKSLRSTARWFMFVLKQEEVLTTNVS